MLLKLPGKMFPFLFGQGKSVTSAARPYLGSQGFEESFSILQLQGFFYSHNRGVASS
jgi:hypothetical protein